MGRPTGFIKPVLLVIYIFSGEYDKVAAAIKKVKTSCGNYNNEVSILRALKAKETHYNVMQYFGWEEKLEVKQAIFD